MKRISFLTGTIVLACLFAAASVNAQEICRTAGFWGTHAGQEKQGSNNITEAVMEAWLFSIGMSPNFRPPSGCTDQFGAVSCNFEPPGPAGSPKECREAKRNAETVPSIDVFGTSVLDICGQMISLNDVPPPMDPAPVVEALCVSPKGDPTIQLARQLTAAALNCIMSGGGPTCAGTSIGSEFSQCNTVCEDPSQADQTSLCIEKVDCFNNGGVWDYTASYCQLDLANSCHDQPLTFTIVGQGPF